MAGVGAPKGNKNAAKARLFEQALTRAIKQRDIKEGDGETLRKVAEQMLDLALAADLPAIKEIRDTLDGKPAQAVTVSGDEENPIQTVTKIVLTSE